MEIGTVQKAIHEHCDALLEKSGFTVSQNKPVPPFCTSVIYKNPSRPRFEVDVFAEDDIPNQSTAYGIHISDVTTGDHTYPHLVAEAVYGDRSLRETAGLEELDVIYCRYGSDFFTERVLTNPSIQWF